VQSALRVLVVGCWWFVQPRTGTGFKMQPRAATRYVLGNKWAHPLSEHCRPGTLLTQAPSSSGAKLSAPCTCSVRRPSTTSNPSSRSRIANKIADASRRLPNPPPSSLTTPRHETMSTESTRPLLLPQNRKLRHLRGIALRSLAFSRPRGRTLDDAALNKSPAKLESLRHTPRLHHALSSETLRPPGGRRRSTNLGNADPATRQRQFEETFDNRLADAFFSLHFEGQDDPIYISEVEERATVRPRAPHGCGRWPWLTTTRTSTSASSS
jgi:hypothetical protein